MNNDSKIDTKRLAIAVGLSIVFMTVWNYFFPAPVNKNITKPTVEEVQTKVSSKLDVIKNDVEKREVKEVFLENDNTKIGFDQNSGRVISLVLKGFKKDGESINIMNGSFGEFGASWNGTMPEAKLKSSGKDFLILEQSDGVVSYTLKLKLDDRYMVKVYQSVKNLSKDKVERVLYARTNKAEKKEMNYSSMIYFDGKINDLSYKKLKKLGENEFKSSNITWLGMNEQYWLRSIISRDSGVSYGMRYVDDSKSWQLDLSKKVGLNSGENFELESWFFGGPKQLDLLNNYERELGIKKFEKAIDFGFFYFVSKPLLILIKKLDKATGNFAIAILIMTIIVRLIILPLANKSYKSMARMKKVSPRLKALQEEFGDDKMAIQRETMRIYKDEKINPFVAFVPILFQIPVFFAFYKVLNISIEMKGAPMFGWIKDLSEPDPTSLFNLFGLLPFGVPEFLKIGVLPIIMGITMFLQQKTSPNPSMGNKDQERVMKMMPLIFVLMSSSFPAGLILYWICSNVFSIFQQYFINKMNNE